MPLLRSRPECKVHWYDRIRWTSRWRFLLVLVCRFVSAHRSATCVPRLTPLSYGCCIDANTYVHTSEIFPSHIRGRGLSFGVAFLFLSTIAYLEAAPTAFAQVGWKYYLLFIILTVINIPIIWWYFPETKGLSLEEIGEKFGDEVVVHLTHITTAERQQLDRTIEAEKVGDHAVHVEGKDLA